MAAFSFHLPDFDAPPNDATQPNTSSDASPPNFDAEPLFTIPDYDTAVPPAPADAAIGSFEYDLQHNYHLRWASWDAMRAWMKAEQHDKSIEFLRKESPPRHSSNTAWDTTTVYICARQADGCPCRLTVKTYPGTAEVLGFYKAQHSHATGDENLKYTRLDAETRAEIEKLLRQGMDPKKVLDQITKKMYREGNLDDLRSKRADRRHFATRADIRRIQKMIEEETIRLASGDGASVLAWVQKLRDEGHFVFLKRSDEPPPPGSNLDPDSFVLIIQTKYQRECWHNYGSRFAGIDGTHNTTHYENMTLFTLLLRDNWGHGMPAAWMIFSNGQEVTIDHFLATILAESPTIKSDIEYDPDTRKFRVRSQSDPAIVYNVDLDAYDCTCLSFPLIRFCKHMCAVQHHFPEEFSSIPVASLKITPEPDAEGDSNGEESSESESESGGDTEIARTRIDLQTVDDLAQQLESLASLAVRDHQFGLQRSFVALS
ncbi:hypothetical protein B0H17DRAFT_1215974 [Mycena rosella]|uniref:SWIM-type domain-containing protein n=1 Tax=Mycena rosella TaxID=1033263 RepID=A0AAD7FZB8_MYCRO|nr:hypothetical protein B0H17DRAFT_1215974 [Mycena rosella]